MGNLFTFDNAIDILCLAYCFFCGYRLRAFRNYGLFELFQANFIIAIGKIFYSFFIFILIAYVIVKGYQGDQLIIPILEIIFGAVLFFKLNILLAKKGIIKASSQEEHPVMMMFYSVTLPIILLILFV